MRSLRLLQRLPPIGGLSRLVRVPGPRSRRVWAVAFSVALAASILVGGAGVSGSRPLYSHLPGTTPGLTERVSLDPQGSAFVRPSVDPSISADGRFVAFSAEVGPPPTGGDEGAPSLVHVRDLVAEATTVVPLGGISGAAGSSNVQPSISGDGRYVAFTFTPGPVSSSPLFVTVRLPIVLVHDREAGLTSPVSLGLRDLGPSYEPSISADGRFVAFTSSSFRVGTGDNEAPDVFVRDLATNETTLVSASQNGFEPDGQSSAPSISADGRFVAFESTAADLVLEDSNQAPDIFVRDRLAGTTTLVSMGAELGAGAPSISADGRFVAFESSSAGLIAGDLNQASDVFVRDLTTGATVLASVSLAGLSGSGASRHPSISADSRFVSFESTAADLVGDDTTGSPGGGISGAVLAAPADVFVRDLARGETVRASVDIAGHEVIGDSRAPSISTDGRFVAYQSWSPVLVPGDANGTIDVFIRDHYPVVSVDPDPLAFGIQAVGTQSADRTAMLSNTGFGPLVVERVELGGADPGDFQLVSTTCPGATLYRGDVCTIGLRFVPTDIGGRSASIQVRHSGPGSPRPVGLVGTGARTSLRLDPPLGPPGFVSTVIGEGFPQNEAVELRWTRGLMSISRPIVAGPDGTFRVPILIFHHDVLGLRRLIATLIATPPFSDVATAAFLVVPGPGQPPLSSSALALFRDLGSFVSRR